MKVIQTIQSVATNSDGFRTNDPVEICYYSGDALTQAMAAMVSATAEAGRDTNYTEVLSVRIEF